MAYQKLNLAEQLDGSLWLMQPIAGRFRMQQQHTHRELEFNLVLSGRGAYVIDERRYELSRGTLLWLFPRQQHVLVDISDDFAMWIGVFKPKLLRRACRTAQTQPLRRLLPRGLFCKQLVIDPLERLDGFCDDLATWESTPDRYNAGLAHLLMQAWWAFEEADEITQTMDIHAAVERAARMLRDAEQDVSMGEVAKTAGLSESHLSRLFREQTGVSMVQFRQRCMVERFLQLYGRGRRMNMTEAALAAGFGSYVQFHRVFSRLMGRGPAEHFRRLERAD